MRPAGPNPPLALWREAGEWWAVEPYREVRRFIAGGYSPLYQCGYMMGGLQLRALRQEIVGAGKMSDQEFNDTVLTYNTMPIELIRAGMLNLPLARDTKSSWRFYDHGR